MAEALLPAAVAVATGFFCWLATGALIPILRRRDMLDYPNERSSHFAPTPRGGGIAVTGSVLLAWISLRYAGLVAPGVMGIALGAGLLAVVSWIDDLRGLSPGLRLVMQALAVAIGLALLPEASNEFEAWSGPALYFAAIGLVWIWWINLFNFMDGIDGLAVSEAAAIGAGLLLFASVGAGADPALRTLSAAVTGAAIGFLVWNWSPARIFLGDVGSVPLGYVLGFLLLDLAVRGHWKIALILPLYFLADATITLARRFLRGERIWQAHREHFYQQAVRRGLGHAAVVKRVIVADLVLIGSGWAAENGWSAISLAISAAIVAILLAALARGSRDVPTLPREPYIRGNDGKSSPDPPRADFGQRQKRVRCIRWGAGSARCVDNLDRRHSTDPRRRGSLRHRGSGNHRGRGVPGRPGEDLAPGRPCGAPRPAGQAGSSCGALRTANCTDRSPRLQPLSVRRDGRVGRQPRGLRREHRYRRRGVDPRRRQEPRRRNGRHRPRRLRPRSYGIGGQWRNRHRNAPGTCAQGFRPDRGLRRRDSRMDGT